MLSITTVAKINEPPINVFRVGISFKKMNAMIIPKIGCMLPMILAVLTEKYFKEWINNECPIAVVIKANNIMYENCVLILLVSIKNIAGRSIILKIII
jgi:hypothetical protein